MIIASWLYLSKQAEIHEEQTPVHEPMIIASWTSPPTPQAIRITFAPIYT